MLSAAHAQPSETSTSSCNATVLSVHAAQGGDDGKRPLNPQWQAVTLPDNWVDRWPGYSGTVWYRIDWKANCDTASGDMLALLTHSIVMAGEIYVNDHLIWRDDSLTEPLSRSWNMPRYWRLSPSMLKDDVNSLWVRVVGVAGQTPGMGQVQLGEAQSIRELHDDLWWRNRTLFFINIVISSVLGSLFFCLWLCNRKQSDYGWYALMTLFWVLFISNVLSTSPWPFPDTASAAKANAAALVLYVACFCMFTWRFGEQHMPYLENGLWFVSFILLIALLVAPATALKEVLAFSIWLPTTFFFLNCLQFPIHALRTRKLEHRLLAIALLIFFGVALYDFLHMLHIITGGKPLTPISSIASMLCMSGVLGLRHAINMQRIERFNEELEQGIDRARTALSATIAREHELVLTNTRLQERLQISHDLHDGLGGTLVRMMAMVEQADKPLQNQQFLSLLKLIRDDLRQTIDTGSSSGIKVPATPGEWIAPLRHRFMQLFDDRDIEATWSLPAQWQTPPNALQCLALTRLVEEALINIVKHSRAHHVQLRLWQPDANELKLLIEDDGVGFDVDAVRQAGISIGMRSMHARIAAVGGTLDVQSIPGHTILIATLQLPAATPTP
ncbi:MAG: 7TM diverse intracellular signaling domain-containing protein [Oxalicibacterium faecigallinarum]|uniref:sensor histidine kinase n=1 Tax=Oxalicibacterium faecigallinarum TaxID=573741 RepID=UPI0028087C0C|nr:7TM diverse intracellular signaling domain-containing protein [Oxalicibacterium faecigallinarum]MDQ7968868.1 7TM diverse intracellular signaling domain-containing protein [Oxalicibacterium faecigallinarum]